MSAIPLGLCQCGCGRSTRIAPQTHAQKGWTKGVPLRFVRGHANRLDALRGYRVDSDTGCWVWQGHVGGCGYGRTVRDGRAVYVHRFMWELVHGRVPEGLELDHLCRNRLCMNPDHLEVVTHRENMRRSPCTKLDPGAVNEIRRLARSGVSNAEIGRRLGLSHGYVCRVARGDVWNDIEEVAA